jgi:hypothetical protein
MRPVRSRFCMLPSQKSPNPRIFREDFAPSLAQVPTRTKKKFHQHAVNALEAPSGGNETPVSAATIETTPHNQTPGQCTAHNQQKKGGKRCTAQVIAPGETHCQMHFLIQHQGPDICDAPTTTGRKCSHKRVVGLPVCPFHAGSLVEHQNRTCSHAPPCPAKAIRASTLCMYHTVSAPDQQQWGRGRPPRSPEGGPGNDGSGPGRRNHKKGTRGPSGSGPRGQTGRSRGRFQLDTTEPARREQTTATTASTNPGTSTTIFATERHHAAPTRDSGMGETDSPRPRESIAEMTRSGTGHVELVPGQGSARIFRTPTQEAPLAMDNDATRDGRTPGGDGSTPSITRVASSTPGQAPRVGNSTQGGGSTGPLRTATSASGRNSRRYSTGSKSGEQPRCPPPVGDDMGAGGADRRHTPTVTREK